MTIVLVRPGPQGSNQISSGTWVCFVAGDSLFSNFAENRRAVLGHSDCVLMAQLWHNRSIHPHTPTPLKSDELQVKSAGTSGFKQLQ